jgi:hypothetical protein
MACPSKLEKVSSCLHEHLLKFGLTMHNGTWATPSKTEAMYFPPPRRLYSDADISRLDVLNYLGDLVGFIDFTTKYLDSIVNHSHSQMQTLISALGQHRPPLGLLKTF